MKSFNVNFNEIAPKCFFYWENQTKSNAMSEVLKEKFLPAQKIDEKSFEGLSILISDGFIGYPTHKFVELTSTYTDVYYYLMKSRDEPYND